MRSVDKEVLKKVLKRLNKEIYFFVFYVEGSLNSEVGGRWVEGVRKLGVVELN